MRHINIAICDDDKNELKILEEIICNYFSCQTDIKITINRFLNTNDLFEHLDFDILFLDILFNKETTGLKAIRKLRKQGISAFVIFISSLESFKASKIGFDCDVYNYVVKPFDAGEIGRILSQILDELEKRKGPASRILLKSENGVNVIHCEDIQYIDIVGRKRQIHKIDSIVTTNRTLKSLYDELPEHQFTYTHNAYIVNLDKVDAFNAQSIFLTDGSEIPLSRSYKNAFCEAINLYTCKGITTHV